MNNQNPLVSIVIPTKNSALFLRATLASIKSQSYPNIEVIVVDGQSHDATLDLAKEFDCRVLQFDPHMPAGTFDAPHRRNYGAQRAAGEFIYYVDADMELGRDVVTEAVQLCRSGDFQAAIIPEDSFGVGPWAQAKNLERRCYWGDDTIEAPRFFVAKIWKELGGLDESLGGGGDDWDLYQKLLNRGYKVAHTKALIKHNEGKLELGRLCRKRFMYGRDAAKYIAKRPRAGVKSYFPIRAAYLRNWRLFLSRPVDTFYFIIMRSAEYAAGLSGAVYSIAQQGRHK